MTTTAPVELPAGQIASAYPGRPARLAFIGVGGIARNYLKHLGTMKTFAQVVAICDILPERAAEVAEPLKAKAYTDYRVMLENEELDGVFVCVPPFAHTDQELQVVAKKLALFVAKPVALDLGKAREVGAAIREAGIINSVGYMWRYSGITNRAREILAGSEANRAGSSKLALLLGFTLTSLPGTLWWRQAARSGGQIIEQTTHIFDLLRYFGGEVREVSGLGGLKLLTDVPLMDVPDVTTCNLLFESGAVGNVSSTSAITGGRYAVELIARSMHLNLLYIPQEQLTATIDKDTVEATTRIDPYHEIVRVFVEAIRSGNQSLIRSSYADAARTLALTIAATRSVDSGKTEQVEAIEI